MCCISAEIKQKTVFSLCNINAKLKTIIQPCIFSHVRCCSSSRWWPQRASPLQPFKLMQQFTQGSVLFIFYNVKCFCASRPFPPPQQLLRRKNEHAPNAVKREEPLLQALARPVLFDSLRLIPPFQMRLMQSGGVGLILRDRCGEKVTN